MPTWISHLNEHDIIAAAIVSVALAVLLAGITLLLRAVRQGQSQETVDRAIAERKRSDSIAMGDHLPADAPAGHLSSALGTAATLGARWGAGRFGEALLAEEDRQLIDAAGYQDIARARAYFLFARVALGMGLPVICLLGLGNAGLPGSPLLTTVILIFFGFALGWMLPKWSIKRHIAKRKLAAAEELPLLIDLLRLLQGVGLSVDQSLHVVVHEFAEVMPVLSGELEIAVDQHARGRSREQSLLRLSNGFDNDDLSAICRLIVQIDQHGGATQQPLHHFSERLREQRKLDLKEKTGKLTVKMTGVMVLTLMPALLIITGGAGFLAVIRGLSRMGGG